MPIPKETPERVYWYCKMINNYILYDKFPWDLGYKPYAEFDNLFPFVIKELHKKDEHQRKAEKDYEEQKNSR